MKTVLWFFAAAAGEIAGCFAFWMWLRLKQGPWPLAFGIPALLFFAYALTRVDSESASRSYAAYSAIYLVSSLIAMRVLENTTPDR